MQRTGCLTVSMTQLHMRLTRSYGSSVAKTPRFMTVEDFLKHKEKVVTLDTRSPADFEGGHIPGSRNAHDVFTYLLPSSSAEDIAAMQKHFSKVFSEIGLSRNDHVVVTERGMTKGFGQSCRSWFLLRALGHPEVSVLNGGIEAFINAGGALETGPSKHASTTYVSQPDEKLFATAEDVMNVLSGTSKAKLLDVRDRVEWVGKSSSPYGVDFCPRKGRIPGALYAEWYQFMDQRPEFVTPKSPERVQAMMRELGISPDDEIIVYCFKGSRASNTLMILMDSGFKNVRNYFGSWNEWSRDNKYPVDNQVLSHPE